jgi:Asp-tRNA(Asn)/Glu-tRNA(Gln) amidotransferase C subunit
MLEGNSSICKLGINTILSDKIAIERFQQFAQVLAQNHTLESLTLELGDLEEMHSNALDILLQPMMPNATNCQPNTTIREDNISYGMLGRKGMESFTNMLEVNTSLHSLKLIPYVGYIREPHQCSDMSKLLNALKHNKTLMKLDLSKCEILVGKEVLGTIMDMLQVNFSLEELLLHGTPFQRDGSDVIVQTQLKKNVNTRIFYKGLTQ